MLRFKVDATSFIQRESDPMSTPQPAASLPPLWPQPIPIIGATGEKFSGKTKFGLNICPGNRTTLVYDFEQSSASYEQEYARIGVPFDRIDVPRAMHDYKDEKGNYPYRSGYKSIDQFIWWYKHVRAIKPGQYRVIMVDPITDLERGLTDWVDANPTYFGHTSGQYSNMSGIKWGDVKDFEKIILSDLTARCETFYFIAHLGAEFSGKSPTGKKKAKGKETLYELANLYLWFDRSPNKQTGVRPNVPSASVEKGRMEKAELIDGEVVSFPILPARLPEATPKKIRWYFENPAGKREATEEERIKEEVLSADERLKLEVAKAEAERDTAQARAAQAQAAQPTVVITCAPPEDRRNSPESWEANFENAIKIAKTADELEELKPQIKTAKLMGFIGEDHLGRLRLLFDERLDHLQSLAESVGTK